jgi:hypothetical protein
MISSVNSLALQTMFGLPQSTHIKNNCLLGLPQAVVLSGSLV